MFQKLVDLRENKNKEKGVIAFVSWMEVSLVKVFLIVEPLLQKNGTRGLQMIIALWFRRKSHEEDIKAK